MKQKSWSKESWRSYPVNQQPPWPDLQILESAVSKLSKLLALVFAGETRSLKQQLAEAYEGKAFVLQCGDCSEDFSGCHGPRIHNLLKVILQMSVILAYAGEKKVVNIGRIAGQYAKPRTSDFEEVNGTRINSYRGDMVNHPDPVAEKRIPDPNRMVEGYFRAAASLNLLRAFTHGGYASLEHVSAWHRDFCDAFPANDKYEELVYGINKSVNF